MTDPEDHVPSLGCTHPLAEEARAFFATASRGRPATAVEILQIDAVPALVSRKGGPKADPRAQRMLDVNELRQAFKVLALLLARGSRYGSIVALSHEVGMSRQGVYRALDLARDAGYGAEVDQVLVRGRRDTEGSAEH